MRQAMIAFVLLLGSLVLNASGSQVPAEEPMQERKLRSSSRSGYSGGYSSKSYSYSSYSYKSYSYTSYGSYYYSPSTYYYGGYGGYSGYYSYNFGSYSYANTYGYVYGNYDYTGYNNYRRVYNPEANPCDQMIIAQLNANITALQLNNTDSANDFTI